MEEAVSAPLLPLAFVGCWNRELRTPAGALIPDGPRELVAAAVSAANPQTIILGGDNIYAPATFDEASGTVKKGEIYNRDAFVRGAQLYPGPQVYVAVGNHNIDTEGADFNILETERATFGAAAMPATYYRRTFADGLSIVVIDTNLVQAGREAEFATMLTWLKGVTDKPYLLIQHEPFASIAKKKDGVNVYKHLPRYQDILNTLFVPKSTRKTRYNAGEQRVIPPIAILCADTHNYQFGTITYNGITVPQYVVGTGGAKPDPLIKPILGAATVFKPHGTDGLTYRYDHMIDGFGFLLVSGTPSSLNFRFELTKTAAGIPIPWRGGSRRRRRRLRRTKRTKSRHRVRGQ